MSLRRYACHGMIQQPFSSTQVYLWISDEILFEAFHHFTLSTPCIRRGSSIPGPLEARKRSANRRMTSQTFIGVGPSLDAGPLLGMGGRLTSKDLLWEPPSSMGKAPTIQPDRKGLKNGPQPEDRNADLTSSSATHAFVAIEFYTRYTRIELVKD